MKTARVRFLVIVLIACLAAWLVLLGVERWYAEGPNYSLIEESLYMGGHVTRPPRGTKAVVNLCDLPDPYQCDTQLWEPIRDGEPAPGIEWLRQVVEFIHNQRQAGNTTYVHCLNGVSRSGLVVTAYLMFEHGWTRDQALEFLRSRRPVARPNRFFMERLLEWEAALETHEGAGTRT